MTKLFNEPCGGCGEKFSNRRCIGCFHEMTSDTALPVELEPCPFCGGTDINTTGPCYDAFMCNGCGVSQYDQAGHAEAIAAWNTRDLTPTRIDLWEPIETAPKDRTPVIVAVPTKERDDHIVGEAYFDPEHDDGDWWWAGTGYGDYHGGPISEINHHMPTHWHPLPAPPITTEGE